MTGIPKVAAGFGLWKIGAIVAIIISLAIGAFAVKTQIESNQVAKQRDQLQRSISDPVTGYIARLTTAQNNVVVLEKAVERQNTELRRQSAESKAQLDRLRIELRVAQAQTRVYQGRVKELMAKPIKGNTPAERYDDVDKMIMEDLRK